MGLTESLLHFPANQAMNQEINPAHSPEKRWIKVASFLLLLIPSLAFSLEFTSPILDRLNVPEMGHWYDRLRSTPSAGPNALNLGLLEYHLSENYCGSQQIHQCQQMRDRALERCGQWERERFAEFNGENTTRALYLCALVSLEKKTRSLGVSFFEEEDRWQQWLSRARQAHLPRDEKWLVEGQINAKLPEYQRSTRAVVGLASLVRARVDLVSPRYWLGLTYLHQGKLDLARELFLQAETDSRAEQLLGEGLWEELPEELDGLFAGWGLGAFYNDALGLGVRFDVYDDRLGDEKRSAGVSMGVGTAPSVQFRGQYFDEVALAPFQMGASVDYQFRNRNVYGLGIESLDTVLGGYQGHGGSVQWQVSREKAFYFFGVGWRLSGFNLSSGDPAYLTLPVSDLMSGLASGPAVSMGFNNQDSLHDPRRGFHWRVSAFFPSRGMGSERTFSHWKFDFDSVFMIEKLRLRARVNHHHLTGVVPFFEYPSLGEGVRGIRPDRFRDRNHLAVNIESRLPVWGPLHLGLGALAGTTSSEWDKLLTRPVRLGGVFFLDIFDRRYRKQYSSVDFSVFAGEFFLSVNSRTEF